MKRIAASLRTSANLTKLKVARVSPNASICLCSIPLLEDSRPTMATKNDIGTRRIKFNIDGIDNQAIDAT